MSKAELILEHLLQEGSPKQSLLELAQSLGIPQSQTAKLHKHTALWLRNGLIAEDKEKRLSIVNKETLVLGTLAFQTNGKATLIPKDKTRKGIPDRLTILAENTGTALHQDRVAVRLVRPRRSLNHRRHGRRKTAPRPQRDAYTGRVACVLHRAHTTLTGTLQREGAYHIVIPDNPRIVYAITVPHPKEAQCSPKPKINDKVIVQLKEWRHSHLHPEGSIIQALGKTHTPKAEQQALLHQYGLKPTFPPKVMAELDTIQQTVTDEQRSGRQDCRKHFTFTIDPDDAKDFDDALSLQSLPQGAYRVGIHIADVNAYVPIGSALDREAYRRGNSSYLVGQVIPMLPEALSNGICSLVEGEDRLTKSVFLTFDDKGEITDTEFANTVIHSQKRLTYTQAYDLLCQNTAQQANREKPSYKEDPLQKTLQILQRLASHLRTERLRQGSLDLNIPEIKIHLDAKGYADRIERLPDDESHWLIEEFMLAANESVARALSEASLPIIHRTHDDPDPKQLDELREYLATLGIHTGDLAQRSEVTKLLETIREHSQSYTLRIEFLRRLQKAGYRAQGDGHYGLNKFHYTHFTSPIRRYADLVVHRVLDAYLFRLGTATAPAQAPNVYSKSELTKIAEHLSQTEVNSVEAERESVKIKLLEYFERELKKDKKTHFDAVISDIRSIGIFIELTENAAWGLITMASLRRDGYAVSPAQDALIDRQASRASYPIGSTIQVTVEQVERYKRQINFRIAGT